MSIFYIGNPTTCHNNTQLQCRYPGDKFGWQIPRISLLSARPGVGEVWHWYVGALLQLQTDFQFTTLNGCDITREIFNLQIWLCNFETSWVLCHISVISFQITKRCFYTVQWFLHTHAKFQPIPSGGLPCRCDRPLTFFYAKNQVITP